jgi:hypothetical protein
MVLLAVVIGLIGSTPAVEADLEGLFSVLEEPHQRNAMSITTPTFAATSVNRSRSRLRCSSPKNSRTLPLNKYRRISELMTIRMPYRE